MTEISKQWEKLTRHDFANIDDSFLKYFRAPGSANKFVAWDPYERSTRYLKFLLFAVAQKQSEKFFEAYKKLKGCNFGNPLTIRYSDCDINADYLAAVEEWEFLGSSTGLDDVNTIVEIGAGFGRTCHTMLTLCPRIEEYIIIDLEPMLNLSQSYLNRVAPDVFKRIRFISSNDYVSQDALAPDLVINVDSFQEMPLATIDGYMTQVVQKARKFYCKNPVGKYLPGTVGLPDLKPDQLLDVFDLGYCQSVIDIFNDSDLQEARVAYVDAYRPPASNGCAYNVAASKVMELFPYFHHVLYVRQ